MSKITIWFGKLFTVLLLALLTSTAAFAAPYKKLVLGGPTAAVSFPLIHMAATGALSDWADQVEFRHWKNVDQLRVLLAKQELDYSAVPVNLPAIMSNRGMQVKLLNVSVWGLLWFVSNDPKVQTLSDLAGQPLLTTYQRDLPAILLDQLLVKQDMVAERAPEIRYTREAQDAITLLLTGKASNALLPEPVVSLLLQQNNKSDTKPIHRVVSMEHAWADAFPDNPILPQAGVMANSQVVEDDDLNTAVIKAYAKSALWCKSKPDECADLVHKTLNFLPRDAIAESISVTKIQSESAQSVRDELESLYQLILDHNPQGVGGKLPVAGFYGQ